MDASSGPISQCPSWASATPASGAARAQAEDNTGLAPKSRASLTAGAHPPHPLPLELLLGWEEEPGSLNLSPSLCATSPSLSSSICGLGTVHTHLPGLQRGL